MAFYEVFDRLCNEKGVTPTQVARDNGLTQQTVSHWKTRGSTPKAQTIQKLADYFGVSTADLIGDETTVIIPAEASFTASLGGKVRATAYRNKMNIAFDRLNLDGQQKAVERVEELTEISRYRAETPPPPPPASPEGKDTVPPPPPPESPENGG